MWEVGTRATYKGVHGAWYMGHARYPIYPVYLRYRGIMALSDLSLPQIRYIMGYSTSVYLRLGYIMGYGDPQFTSD